MASLDQICSHRAAHIPKSDESDSRHTMVPVHLTTLSASSPDRDSPLPQYLAHHDQPHDLVRALQNLVHSKVTDDLLNAIVGKIAVSAEHLQRFVGDPEADVGRKLLGHRAKPGCV